MRAMTEIEPWDHQGFLELIRNLPGIKQREAILREIERFSAEILHLRSRVQQYPVGARERLPVVQKARGQLRRAGAAIQVLQSRLSVLNQQLHLEHHRRFSEAFIDRAKLALPPDVFAELLEFAKRKAGAS